MKQICIRIFSFFGVREARLPLGSRASKSVVLLALFFAVVGGLAYYRYAHAAAIVWNGMGFSVSCGGPGNIYNWSCGANWVGGVAPGGSDIATFNGTSSKNATIDGNISVAGIAINAGYTGTITQSGSNTVTVGASNFVQGAGTFTGGSGAITINGTYTLSGGIFTAPTGTLQVGYYVGACLPSMFNTFTVSGGTFNHNNGTVAFVFSGMSYSCTEQFTVPGGGLTLYNIVINASHSGEPSYVHNITTSGGVITAANDFTQTDGAVYGTWQVQGNVIIGAAADGGTGTLTYTGTGSKTYSYVAGGKAPYLQVNNAAVSVSAAGGTTDLSAWGFVLLAGTFTAPTGTLQVGYYVGACLPSTFNTFTVSGGTFNHNNGTVAFVFSGTSYSCTEQFTVPGGGLTLYNIVINASHASEPSYVHYVDLVGGALTVAGSFTHASGVLSGTWYLQGDVSIGAGADGGTAPLTFTGPNNQTYANAGGNEPDGVVTINKPAGLVTLAGNANWNAASQTLTITSGKLAFAKAYNLATGALTIGSGGVLKMIGTGSLTLGGNVANAGQVVIETNQSCGGADSIQILSSSAGVQRAWSGTGSAIVYDATVKDQGGTEAITAYSSTSVSGNGGNWTFSGAACPAIPPAVSIGSGLLNIGSGIVNFR